MSISPETTVLRGTRADLAPLARVDSELRTSRYLTDAKPDARLLDPDLVRALDEATRIARTSAAAEGFAAGYASGRIRAVAETKAELDRELATLRTAEAQRKTGTENLLAALNEAVLRLENRLVPTYDEIGQRLGAVAYSLVESIFGRELELSRELALDAMRRACAAAPRGTALTLWLNPLDIESLETIDLATTLGRPVKVVPDPALNRGDALAEIGATKVDACLTNSLARVREVLIG
ncbi:MAG TPA: FliH/SctL family protein [Candidatus Nanopelagicaceae bacterium]|nr:FliH/SctL family protein [Candidatus Nanopelagicaceae bacterium]